MKQCTKCKDFFSDWFVHADEKYCFECYNDIMNPDDDDATRVLLWLGTNITVNYSEGCRWSDYNWEVDPWDLVKMLRMRLAEAKLTRSSWDVAVFVCPYCGKEGFEWYGDKFECTYCDEKWDPMDGQSDEKAPVNIHVVEFEK